MTFTKVCKIGDIASGAKKAVLANGKKVALFNIDGKIYATADDCNHRGGPLSEGTLQGTVVTCPWHGAKFDVTDGEPKGPPAKIKLETYPVRVQEEDVEVDC
jgi:3-phenylpropionate/trans-cinnamate dioxygenase ferredoxin component